MIETPHAKDKRRDVPILALQRDAASDQEDARPHRRAVVDLQDVGARIYTFIYTMANACARQPGTACRSSCAIAPNPIGGTQVEDRRSSGL